MNTAKSKYGEQTRMIRALLGQDMSKTWTYDQVEEMLGPCNASGILGTLKLRGEIEKIGQERYGHARRNVYRPTAKLGTVEKSGPRNPRVEQPKLQVICTSGHGILGVTVHRLMGDEAA